jgi:hypothetical protein
MSPLSMLRYNVIHIRIHMDYLAAFLTVGLTEAGVSWGNNR